MIRRRKNQGPFTSPVLIGAVTVLAILVGVLLAYNANKGLPFLPTRELNVDISDGSDLVVGNDVREGGFLIGLVSAMKPVTVKGNTVAQMTLKLTGSPSQQRVPVNSTVTIDSKSVLGLKYVAIDRGNSSRVYPNGATVPIGHTTVPVQLDDVFDMFNVPTRKAIDDDLVGGGDALAGRGSGLNDTIHSLPSLFSNLTPVARYLAAPSTRLIPFINDLNGLTSTIEPVAPTLAHGLADTATTFRAISRSPSHLERTIARSPSTLRVATRSLHVQQPLLTDLTTLGRALTPATASLRSALPVINPAIVQGSHVLRRTPALDTRLQTVMVSLKNLAQAPGTNLALNGLTHIVNTLDPTIKYLGPFVTVCDDWDYWWTYLAGDLDEETTFGYAQRALLNQTNPLQPNNVGSEGATAPADGGAAATTPLGGDEYLHGPVYGAAVDSQGNADCETGQRGYVKKLNYLDPQGRDLDTDEHTPGDQGSTFAGQAHVPKGETFSRAPLIGPQTPSNPTNP